jgi:hypothetical protein
MYSYTIHFHSNSLQTFNIILPSTPTSSSLFYFSSSEPLRLIYTCNAAPMPRSCRAHAVPRYFTQPCRAPSILRQCRVLRVNPRGSRKYPNCLYYSLTDWCASDNNLRVTPRGTRKNPKASRSPTCCLWTAGANLHIPCHAHAALRRGLEKSLSELHGRGTARARYGMCESNTVALFKSNEKDTI